MKIKTGVREICLLNFKTLNSSSNQVYVVLVERQTYRSIGWKGESRNTHTNIPNWFLTKVKEQLSGGKIAFETNGVGAIGQPPIKQNKKHLNLTQTPYYDKHWILREKLTNT